MQSTAQLSAIRSCYNLTQPEACSTSSVLQRRTPCEESSRLPWQADRQSSNKHDHTRNRSMQVIKSTWTGHGSVLMQPALST
eukprot:6467931-Amphidinium_carterae.1